MTGSAWTVRFAAPADVPDLLRLIRALAEYEKLAHLVVADEARLAAALFGERPAAEALIARAGGETGPAAGFALFFPTFSTFLGLRGLWLEDLFVVPEMRGRGLGRRLLTDLAALARARGCGRFEWSVLDWNTPARDLYFKLGARSMDEWTVFRMTPEAFGRLAREGVTGGSSE
jgi:GNAT superfamily N-acetyltransferase